MTSISTLLQTIAAGQDPTLTIAGDDATLSSYSQQVEELAQSCTSGEQYMMLRRLCAARGMVQRQLTLSAEGRNKLYVARLSYFDNKALIDTAILYLRGASRNEHTAMDLLVLANGGYRGVDKDFFATWRFAVAIAESGEPMGMAVACPYSSLKYPPPGSPPDLIHIRTIFARRVWGPDGITGVGTAILEELIHYSFAEGYSGRLKACYNTFAAAFYDKMGFVVHHEPDPRRILDEQGAVKLLATRGGRAEPPLEPAEFARRLKANSAVRRVALTEFVEKGRRCRHNVTYLQTLYDGDTALDEPPKLLEEYRTLRHGIPLPPPPAKPRTAPPPKASAVTAPQVPSNATISRLFGQHTFRRGASSQSAVAE